jgi:spermidine/putrescine transport system permease protein
VRSATEVIEASAVDVAPRDWPATGSVPRRPRTAGVTALLFTPAALYFILFFVVPLGILFLYSFYTYNNNYGWTSKLTLANYGQVLTSPIFRAFYLRTLWIALLVSTIVVVVSYFMAYVLTFVLVRARRVIFFLILVSLFGGYLVRIYAWRTVLGRDGLVNRVLIDLAIVNRPVTALLNSDIAIVIAMVNFLIPLGVLPIYSAMQNISPHLFEAAIDLGASRVRTARTIVLPLSARGLAAAFGFSFIATMAEWVTPQLLGGPLNQFVGNAIQYQFDYTLNWPLGAALALTLIATVVVFLGILFVLFRFALR